MRLSARFKIWLDAERDRHLPKGPMSVAIHYALDQWDELSLFLTDPRLPIDNNVSERALRIAALGRKNFLLSGTTPPGRTWQPDELATIRSSLTFGARVVSRLRRVIAVGTAILVTLITLGRVRVNWTGHPAAADGADDPRRPAIARSHDPKTPPPRGS